MQTFKQGKKCNKIVNTKDKRPANQKKRLDKETHQRIYEIYKRSTFGRNKCRTKQLHSEAIDSRFITQSPIKRNANIGA